MAYHNKFIPWWTSLPDNIRKDIVNDLHDTSISNNSLCEKYKSYKLKSCYIFYLKKMCKLTNTVERDMAIQDAYTSGVPDYVIKKEYGIDNIELNAVKDVFNIIGFDSLKLF